MASSEEEEEEELTRLTAKKRKTDWYEKEIERLKAELHAKTKRIDELTAESCMHQTRERRLFRLARSLGERLHENARRGTCVQGDCIRVPDYRFTCGHGICIDCIAKCMPDPDRGFLCPDCGGESAAVIEQAAPLIRTK